MKNIKINQLYQFAGICALTLKVSDMAIAAKLRAQLNGEDLPKPYAGLILDSSGDILLLSKFAVDNPKKKAVITIFDGEDKIIETWDQKTIPALSNHELSDFPEDLINQLADTLLNRMPKAWGAWSNDEIQIIAGLLGLKTSAQDSKSTLIKSKDDNEVDENELECKFNAELVVKTKKGLLITGWVFDPNEQVADIFLRTKGKQADSLSLFSKTNGALLKRTLRPDVTDALQQGFKHDLHGFVIYVPASVKGTELDLVIATNTEKIAKKSVKVSPISESIIPRFESVWKHSGQALLNFASQLKEDEQELEEYLNDIDISLSSRHGGVKIAACDRAWFLNSEVLILEGWISAPSTSIKTIKISCAGKTYKMTDRLVRTIRPDLHAAFPWSINKPIGFILSVKSEELLGQSIKLRVETNRDEVEIISLRPQPADWGMLQSFLLGNTRFAEPMIDSLTKAYAGCDTQVTIIERLNVINHQVFMSIYQSMPTYVESQVTTFASIDRAFALGDGVLILGWHYEPLKNLKSIKLYGPNGHSEDISDSLFKVARMDVANAFRDRWSDITEYCGYLTYIPFPTNVGESRALCFDCGVYGKTWLKVPTDLIDKSGVALVKEILNMIPAPDKIQHKLYELFDKHLGPAINLVAKDINFEPTGVAENQFGSPPKSPKVSVIVPLYGRYDFLRHQLAHFSQDDDFKNVDLIYVVDDPAIINPTISLATVAHSAFNVPFRVISYDQNLGFGGANNVAVKRAKGEYLVLLNSDVIPTSPGWVNELTNVIDKDSKIGAVGPLLLFPDGSIQHAGMVPMFDSRFKDFLLNAHPNKGQKWTGSDAPKVQNMLTAACLMIRRKDYLEIGGFDQGYLIGDFEDSDLCLALKKLGKSVWLVPKAKLWHLERQSQSIGVVAGFRQLITLYNGWRYKKKIENDQIASPLTGGAK